MGYSEWIALGGIAATLALWWLVRREQSIRLEERLKAHRDALNSRIELAEKFIQELRDWKHDQYGPTISRIEGVIVKGLERSEQRDKFIQELRDFKHLKAEPYIGAMDAMNRRVERLERILNGKLT